MSLPHGSDLILHILDHSLPELSGYSVRSHNLLRELRRAGFAVAAVSGTSRETTAREEEVDGVHYIRLPFRLEGAPQDAGVLWRRIVRFGSWLSAEVPRRRVALLHAHTPVLSFLPALWAARRRRVPLVYEVRGLWEDGDLDRRPGSQPDWRYRLTRSLETAALRRADAVTTISEGLRGEILRRGVPPERVSLAPNGVDSSVFSPQPPDAALLASHGVAGRFIVGFIGYFFAYEGIDDLIHGFADMLPRVPEATLLLVGTGENEALLRGEVQRLGIGAQVIFAGEAPHSEIRRYYSICDVLVYPRRSCRTAELTTPLKPLEAMAMGKPVIASSVGGLRELVRDGDTGLLYPAGEPQRLAETLTSLATDAALRNRLGANARRFVCEERSWGRAVQSYKEIYSNLVRRAAGGA